MKKKVVRSKLVRKVAGKVMTEQKISAALLRRRTSAKCAAEYELLQLNMITKKRKKSSRAAHTIHAKIRLILPGRLTEKPANRYTETKH
jgi:hypothetical protein